MRILIHGGFFSESSQSNETKHKKQQALLEILNQGKDFLKNHSALETAVYTAKLLEDNPLFNAGIGSQIQSDGKIRMSAALMDGVNQKFSGVINIEDIQNPVLIAQKLMKEEDRVLGTAERRHEFLTKKQSLGTGTIGCVVQDRKGRLAAATSTGGKGFEIPGRISDSATIAGNYANEYCAISCTGVGEDIVSGGLATKIVTRVTDGMPLEKAFEKSFNELKPYDGFAGAIGVTKKGEIFYQESHPKIVFAAFNGEADIVFT